MTQQSSAYAKYKEKRLELAKLLSEATDAIGILNLEAERRDLKTLSSKALSDTFKIQVVGTFKNGKSTFINSFLGSKVLPAFARPCTAVISEIKYGAERKALLYFRSPTPALDKLPENTPAEVKEHMKRHGGADVPPIEVSVDKIEDYVVIPKGKEPKENLKESPYEKIDLFWPLELLESGVEIIDSPGLNEHGIRTEVTTRYLNKADAILFILAADKPCAKDEMEFIEFNLNGNGFRHLFFLFNRFDQLDNEADRQDIRELAKEKLSERTELKDGIYFVSARDALIGREKGDAALYDSSGMKEFESGLSEFLVNDRGKLKLSQPAHSLKRILEAEVLARAIPQRRGMLESDLNALVARWEAVKPKLEDLKEIEESTRKNVLEIIELEIPTIKKVIADYFAKELTYNITAWINDYEPDTDVSAWSRQKTVDKCSKEIREYVNSKIEESRGVFCTELEQRISDAIAKISAANKRHVKDFFKGLDAIEKIVAGTDEVSIVSDDLYDHLDNVGAKIWEADPADEPPVILEIGLTILFSPAILMDWIFDDLLGMGESLLTSIKKQIIKEVTESIQKKGHSQIDKIGDAIATTLWQTFEPTLDTMKTQIQQFEAEVNAVIEEKRKGESVIRPMLEQLSVCEKHVMSLCSRVDKFISANLGRR